MRDLAYLQLLAREYPSVKEATSEIVNLMAICSLPKGTEYFFSDLHGEYEAFIHLLRSSSGIIREKIKETFGHLIPEEEQLQLANLIYYPERHLPRMMKVGRYTEDWQKITIYRVVKICREVSSKYTRSKVRKKMPKEFAYIIDELAQRSSDDGEPSGTAGLPMLEVLRKNQLSGVAAVVTRYFGGIKLGAGGLVRAYTGSVSKAVQSCGLARKILMGTFALSADAADAGKLLNIIYQQQLFTVASVEYGQQARILLYMKQEQQDEAERWLTAVSYTHLTLPTT